MFEPIKINADAPAIEAKRIPAFVITKDGKDTEYTIPEEISGATAIAALEIFVARGESGLVLWLAEHALGAEGMEAVLTSEQLSLGQARQLLRGIGEHYMGAVKELGKE